MSGVATVIGRRGSTLKRDRIGCLKTLRFVGVHLSCLAAFRTGVSGKALILCSALYLIRMFGITAGYHRYFSHRSYKTSRVFQFILAWLGCTALQKGPLWWAAHHRHHHRHADDDEDLHSPMQGGLWWAHVGWILSGRYDETRDSLVKDLVIYPELVWLNRHSNLPGSLLAFGCLWAMGWQGLIWGFFLSTVLLYHGTFAVNSLCHVFGRVRYKTRDTSRNNLMVALITMGEGWHNNHHHYATSARMGFRWWEIDLSYYLLRFLSFFGVVWELREPPISTRM